VFGIAPKIRELSDCIKSFSAREIIEANELRCDKCKFFTVHEKKMEFSSLPPILILHLKRFKMTSR
jgi:ubiquitin C-terminal hydrolase